MFCIFHGASVCMTADCFDHLTKCLFVFVSNAKSDACVKRRAHMQMMFVKELDQPKCLHLLTFLLFQTCDL